MEIYNFNLLFWCIHFNLLSLIWKINVWNNSLLIYRRKNKLLFPCLYSDKPSLCHVSVRLEKTKCITCKCQKCIFYSQFNCESVTPKSSKIFVATLIFWSYVFKCNDFSSTYSILPIIWSANMRTVFMVNLLEQKLKRSSKLGPKRSMTNTL